MHAQVADQQNREVFGQYQDNNTLVHPSQPPITITPIPNGKTAFAKYTDRYAKGAFAKIPAIVSNTANEEVALISYPKDPTNGPNQTLANEETLSAFICPSANTSTYRTDTNSQAISATFIPRPWMGPDHASDLLMMFALVKATEIRGRNSNLGSAR
jgi:hypothetical protein